MRLLSACVIVFLVAGFSLPSPGSAATLSGLTVVLDFRGAHSDRSILEMERESESILGSTGIHVDWRLRMDAAESQSSRLVVMTFKGRCEFDPAPRVYEEGGPLAFTKTTDHRIQSFGEVDCDHVVSSTRKAMTGSDYRRADVLVGRALGRVITHEIVHMLTGSTRHAKDGVFEGALSPTQLIGPTLPLDALDVEELHAVLVPAN